MKNAYTLVIALSMFFLFAAGIEADVKKSNDIDNDYDFIINFEDYYSSIQYITFDNINKQFVVIDSSFRNTGIIEFKDIQNNVVYDIINLDDTIIATIISPSRDKLLALSKNKVSIIDLKSRTILSEYQHNLSFASLYNEICYWQDNKIIIQNNKEIVLLELRDNKLSARYEYILYDHYYFDYYNGKMLFFKDNTIYTVNIFNGKIDSCFMKSKNLENIVNNLKILGSNIVLYSALNDMIIYRCGKSLYSLNIKSGEEYELITSDYLGLSKSALNAFQVTSTKYFIAQSLYESKTETQESCLKPSFNNYYRLFYFYNFYFYNAENNRIYKINLGELDKYQNYIAHISSDFEYIVFVNSDHIIIYNVIKDSFYQDQVNIDFNRSIYSSFSIDNTMFIIIYDDNTIQKIPLK